MKELTRISTKYAAPCLPPQEARTLGFAPLTIAYAACEWHMMERVLADLHRGGIPAAIVTEEVWPEVWRTKQGMRTGRELAAASYRAL